MQVINTFDITAVKKMVRAGLKVQQSNVVWKQPNSKCWMKLQGHMYGFHRWDPTTERIAPGHRANSSVHKTHPKEHGGAKNRPDSIDEWSQTRHFHTDAVCNEGDSEAWHSSTCLIRNKWLHVSALHHIWAKSPRPLANLSYFKFHAFPPSKCSMGATKCGILSNDQ